MLSAVTLSHRGAVRPDNEDAVLWDAAIGLLAVADGMGGHNAGESRRISRSMRCSEPCRRTATGTTRSGRLDSPKISRSPLIGSGPQSGSRTSPCFARPRSVPSTPAWAPH